MKGVRLIAAALCALLVLAVPVMADDGWELPGVVDQNDTPALEQPAEPSPESPPAPEPAPPAEPPREPTGDSTGSGTEDGAENGAGNTGEPSHELDDGLWGDWSNPSNIPGMEEPSEKQQELEEARRELEEKQQQRDEAFREAERENAALPEEEEKQKKPAGSKAADAAPTELVLPQREARTGSPVRYILIGALLAGALCIAIYLFTHPAREDDPADETKP
jgi:type IV secretory pathway VirB10-like protein